MLSGERRGPARAPNTLANEDPAKMTHSIIHLASRHCSSIEQLQWPSSRRPHGTTKQSEGSPSRRCPSPEREWHCLPCCSNGPLSRAARSQKVAARLNQRFCRCAAGHSRIHRAALHHLVTRDMMERRTVDGVDKRHDAQRARSRASGAESNPTNTTADPVAAAGGHVGGGVKVWCGERAASGRVASSALLRCDPSQFWHHSSWGAAPSTYATTPAWVASVTNFWVA